MGRYIQRYHLAGALIVVGILSGCATYRTCGFGGCPGDATITANVQALFAQHPTLEAPNLIDVQTLDHVVYLYGLVDTEMERQLAESLALETPGVARVVNSVSLANKG